MRMIKGEYLILIEINAHKLILHSSISNLSNISSIKPGIVKGNLGNMGNIFIW